jgi:hypothetical protein
MKVYEEVEVHLHSFLAIESGISYPCRQWKAIAPFSRYCTDCAISVRGVKAVVAEGRPVILI